MTSEAFQDEAVILEVRNWQTADKYAVCFCRHHGKVPFIAYGAAYPKSTSGRIVQPSMDTVPPSVVNDALPPWT